ncbi:MAG: CDP-alcohol phosphatidyltransferase family protein [Gammaproteobacteria bacterium]|nr:CDP-alcohol phosphatidyltransferase family protein [Gammaproteobacteria bacterium]
MSLSDLPNIISIFRIILVAPVVYLVLQQEYSTALLLFVIAGVSDGVDGFLAKHFHWQSRLGSILDPIADKLLIVSTYAAVTWMGLIPLWLWLVVLLRDIIIVVGGLAYHWMIGKFEMAPSLISKFNTVMQIVLLMVVLGIPLVHPPQWLLDGLIWLTLITVVLSGIDYIVVWGKKALLSMRKAKT